MDVGRLRGGSKEFGCHNEKGSRILVGTIQKHCNKQCTEKELTAIMNSKKKGSQKITTIQDLDLDCPLFLLLFLSHSGWHLQDHGRLSVEHKSKLSNRKDLHTCVELLGPRLETHLRNWHSLSALV